MKHLMLMLCSGLLLLASCDEGGGEVKDLDKTHSVEVKLSTKRLDDQNTLLITIENVYKDNRIIKTITRVDTVPSLSDSLQYMQDDEGYEKMALIPKEYEFFVTVK